MSSNIGGGETAPAEVTETASFQAGPLMEYMQTGLMRVLGLEQTFAVLRDHQEGLIENIVDLGEVQGSIQELQEALSEEATQPNPLLKFLSEHSSKSIYDPNHLGKVGDVAIILGAQDKVIERERQAWAKGPVVKEWLGEAIILRRPSVGMIRENDECPNVGPLYRGIENGKPVSPYYRAGDQIKQPGKLEEVSLVGDGRIVVSRGDSGTELIEMFESVRDRETGLVTHYRPRVAIDRLSRADRLRRSARQAAIKRAGPDLLEL